MKVALVQAPVWWTIDPPLGLAQIAGCTKEAGFEVDIYDLNILLWKDRLPQYETMWLWEQFHFWNQPGVVDAFFTDHARILEPQLERLLSSDAKVIGFSVGLGSQLPSLRLAAMIKAADPSRLIVFGGQYFFRGEKAAEMLAHSPQVDVVIKGAGDEVFPRLVRDFCANGSVAALPGIVLRRPDGGVADGGPLAMSRSLDHLPFADFSGFPLEHYTDQDRIPIAASRGCVWACRFCSTREFWNGYSYMSGERIYAEMVFQRRLYPSRGHVEFYDITANGKPETLARLSQLLIDGHKNNPPMGWKINAILRPEMTRELLFKMRESGCNTVIYGVESGSPRVLRAMNKNFTIETAERVLRDTHEAGIPTTGNFMFGFPGETEEDFAMTLDFVRRNHTSLDKAYASATFTSLEEYSYLTEHQEEFGIKRETEKDSHHLYWRSEDGRNSYPVRLERYKRFRKTCIELGIDAYKGINGALEQDERANLAQYYQYVDDRIPAIEHYLSYLENDPLNAAMRERLETYRADVEALIPCLRLVERANREPAGAPTVLARRCLRRAGAILERLRFRGVLKESSSGAEVWWERAPLGSSTDLLRLKRRLDSIFDAEPAPEQAVGAGRRGE